jgi:glycosyltransferase involved in cell wall biosynthesis
LKILHLFSDWKWTGPAEPVINLCKALEGRGHEVTLAYRKPPHPIDESVEKRVLQEGIHATNRFRLNHALKLSPAAFFQDALHDLSGLDRYLREQRFDIVNTHHSHDHILGGIAARRADPTLVVIRTDHKRDSIGAGAASRPLLSYITDGVITFFGAARDQVLRRFQIPPERVAKVPPALDLDRYQAGAFKEMRSVFGIGPEHVVIGMVARFQKYRKTEVFLEAMKSIVREFPKTRLLLVGRSSQMEESVIRPMQRLGLTPWVTLAGYRTEDYLDTLACMDIFVFLMPGSDGTARALREAIAMGKPAIVADRGILPELVEDGVSGWVVQERPEAMAEAVGKLLRDPGLRAGMSNAARERAVRMFPLDQQAAAVERFYREMISLGRWKGRSPRDRLSGKRAIDGVE